MEHIHYNNDDFLKSNFEIFLTEVLLLSTQSPNSDFSTAQDYVYRVQRARKKENINWYTLAQRIDDIIMRYSSSNVNKDKSLTSALKAYKLFIETPLTETFQPEKLELTPIEFLEGKKIPTSYNRYERDPAARKACIKAQGSACSICGFDFSIIYGDRFKGFIHVHHTIPLAERAGKESSTNVDTLIPVCPNCHAVLHTRSERAGTYTKQEVINFIKEAKTKKTT